MANATEAKVNNDNRRNGTWAILSVVAAIIFGVMAPTYIMIHGLSDAATKHQQLSGHPVTSEKLAAFEVSLREIETQFRAMGERITLEHKNQDNVTAGITKAMDLDNAREAEDVAGAASILERVRFLERHVFGKPMRGDTDG